MSGPIVRSGPSANYTKNWDSVFGAPKATKSSKKPSKPVKKSKPKKKSP